MWKQVPGYNNLECTACGRVRSMEYNRLCHRGNGITVLRKYQSCEYKQYKGGNGYYRISYLDKSKSTTTYAYVHRLIALTWVDGYQDGLYVNHINGIKTDNRAENLEWISNEQNVKHAWETGLVDTRGERSGTAKLTYDKVKAIRRALQSGVKPYTLARLSNMSVSAIIKIQKNLTWKDVKD